MEEITSERRARRKRSRFALVLPAAALLTAATGLALFGGDDVVSAGISCYDQPNTKGNVAVMPATGADPVEACRALWDNAVVGEGAPPTLTACVNRSGAVMVFPGPSQICTDLGLQDLPPDYVEAAERFIAMREDAVKRWYEIATESEAPEDACMSETTATQVASDVLVEHGFVDWIVETATGDYRGRACFNAHGFDSVAKRILIIPSEPGIARNVAGIN